MSNVRQLTKSSSLERIDEQISDMQARIHHLQQVRTSKVKNTPSVQNPNGQKHGTKYNTLFDGLSPMPQRKAKKDLPSYTKEEVAKHCTTDSTWVSYEDAVFDITKWLKYHPGGAGPLMTKAGKDVTEVFLAFHKEEIRRKIWRFQVGTLKDPKFDQLSQDYRELHEEVVASGMNDVMPLWHIGTVLTILTLLVVSLFLTINFPQQPLVQLLGAAFMACMWQQMAFVGHDLGHNSVTHDRKTDYLYGLMAGPLLTGISIGWWKNSHNTHHVATNHLEHDPDVQHLPFMAISKRLLSGKMYSTYHKKVMELNAISEKFIIPIQHLLYYPIMGLARWFLYVQSYLYLATKAKVEYRAIEFAGMIGFAAWLTCLMTYVEGGWMKFAWLMTAHVIAGILHVQITLSHFSMESYDSNDMEEVHDDSFVRSQLATSLDIDCPKWMDFFHGGLQFQAAHHLFPRVPRYRLRELVPMIKKMASKHNVAYQSCSFYEANTRTIDCLREAGKHAKKIHFPIG